MLIKQITKFLKMKQSTSQVSTNLLPHSTGTFPSSQKVLLDNNAPNNAPTYQSSKKKIPRVRMGHPAPTLGARIKDFKGRNLSITSSLPQT